MKLLAQRGDIRKIMLQVIIHDDDDLTRGMVQTRHDRVVLSDILAKVEANDKRVCLCQRPDHVPRRIRTVIVHEDQLVVGEAASQILCDPSRQLRQAVGTPVDCCC